MTRNFKVGSKEEAQEVIAELLLQFGGEAAYRRMREDCEVAKQSQAELARRTAGNLLTSFTTRRPVSW